MKKIPQIATVDIQEKNIKNINMPHLQTIQNQEIQCIPPKKGNMKPQTQFPSEHGEDASPRQIQIGKVSNQNAGNNVQLDVSSGEDASPELELPDCRPKYPSQRSIEDGGQLPNRQPDNQSASCSANKGQNDKPNHFLECGRSNRIKGWNYV